MMPPLMTVGSSPPASSNVATSDVVVVLPWVPAMATHDLQPHQFGQHLRAAHHRQPLGARRHQFRIVALDRGRHHHHIGAVDILCLVADRDLDALVAQPFHVGAFRHVGAGHRVVEIAQHLGDPAHADPPDPDEMDRADVARQFHRLFLKTGHGRF